MSPECALVSSLKMTNPVLMSLHAQKTQTSEEKAVHTGCKVQGIRDDCCGILLRSAAPACLPFIAR